jgi:hypothetical protein
MLLGENVKQRYRKAKSIIAIFIGILLAVQIVLAIVATPIARGILASSLEPGTSLKRLYINLFGGTVTIRGLTINQPDGFGEDPFIDLAFCRVNLSVTALLTGKLHLQDILIDDLAITLITDSNAVMNITRLTGSTESTTIDESATESDAGEGIMTVLEKCTAYSVALTYQDWSGEKPAALNLRNAELGVENVTLNVREPVDVNDFTGLIRLSGTLEHAETPSAHLDLKARIGPLPIDNTPSLIAGITLTGIELDAAGSMVAPGVKTTLGGSVMDTLIQLQIATNLLDFVAEVETAEVVFPIHVGGTLDEPIFYTGTALLGAFSRVANLFGHTAANITGAGLALGKGALDVTAAVGEGAVNIVGGVGKGLLKTVKGVATLDVKEAGGGLIDSVAAVGQGAVDTVVDAGTATVGSVSDATGSATGKKRSDKWSDDKQKRHDINWTKTLAWVDSMITFKRTIPAGNDDQGLPDESEQPSTGTVNSGG